MFAFVGRLCAVPQRNFRLLRDRIVLHFDDFLLLAVFRREVGLHRRLRAVDQGALGIRLLPVESRRARVRARVRCIFGFLVHMAVVRVAVAARARAALDVDGVAVHRRFRLALHDIHGDAAGARQLEVCILARAFRRFCPREKKRALGWIGGIVQQAAEVIIAHVHHFGLFIAGRVLDLRDGILVIHFDVLRLFRAFRRQGARDRDVVQHAVCQCIRVEGAGRDVGIFDRDVIDGPVVEDADGRAHRGPARAPCDGADEVRQHVVRMRMEVHIAICIRRILGKRAQSGPVDVDGVFRRAAEPREQAFEADLAGFARAKGNIDRVARALGLDVDAADVFRSRDLASVIRDIDCRIVPRDLRARADGHRRGRRMLGDADDAADGIRRVRIRRDVEHIFPLREKIFHTFFKVAIAIDNGFQVIRDVVRVDADIRLAIQDGRILRHIRLDIDSARVAREHGVLANINICRAAQKIDIHSARNSEVAPVRTRRIADAAVHAVVEIAFGLQPDEELVLERAHEGIGFRLERSVGIRQGTKDLLDAAEERADLQDALGEARRERREVRRVARDV